MTSPCTTRTPRSALTRTGALVVVFGLSLAAPLAGLSATASAQDAPAGPTTVQAVIGGDGSVSSVKRYGGGDAPAADDLPVKVAISQTVAGDTSTTTYAVENTTVTSKQVFYTDAAGKSATVTQDVALPLVAQLSVRLPASRTDVVATGARITTLADGSRELVWSMVLFNPIGSPLGEVSFSSKGTGNPLARIDVATVTPSSTPGLATTAQAANATVNGNGILNTVATGASEGLLKLADGVGKLLAGLDKLEAGATALNEGITKGADGAKKLAAGSAAAKAGSGKLRGGLAQLADGNGALAEGLRSSTGKPDLTGGADQLAGGLASFQEGLTELRAGVDALPDNPGVAQLKGGLDSIIAGIGSPAAADTLLNGLFKLSLGLDNPMLIGGKPGVKQALQQTSAGLGTAKGGVDQVLAGLDASLVPTTGSIDQLVAALYSTTANAGVPSLRMLLNSIVAASGGCAPPSAATCLPALTAQQVLAGIVAKIDDQSVAGAADVPTTLRGKTFAAAGGLGQISAGLGASNNDPTANNGTAIDTLADLIAAIGTTPAAGTVQSSVPRTLTGGLYLIGLGLDNPTGIGGKPGVKQGAQLVKGGIDQLVTGIVAGLGAAVGTPTDAPTASLRGGAAALGAGAGTLADKLGEAADGADKLAAGAGSAAAGATALDAGLGKIAAGQKLSADGLPAAVDGTKKIKDGLGAVIEGETSVAKGLGDLREQAVGVLQSQFSQGTTLARQQLAGLDASTALAAETPGAATTTYVLTQDENGLNATRVASSGDSGSDTGRNIALAAGGVLLLMGGAAGGYLSGRRKPTV